MEQKLTYTEAFAELKELVSNLENSDVLIDELETKLERASVLVGICKACLNEVEDKTNEIFAQLENLN